MRYFREIRFHGVLNFRDLGGYRTQSGRSMAWHRIFRSGELSYISPSDLARLREKIKLTSILDLRNENELAQQKAKPLDGVGFRYFSVPFVTGDPDDTGVKMALRESTNMGQLSSFIIRYREYGRRVVKALEIIADQGNHPLVFHCSAGKDRTGVLAAILLSTLGVPDEDIVRDYTLSARYIKAHIARLSKDPQVAQYLGNMPAYVHEAATESWVLFLSVLRRDYGSAWGYVRAQGADPTLLERLEKALLV